jgi:hypothetical protein
MFPQWQQDYLEALATRDLPAWGLPSRPQQTRRLLAMLAAVHGQPLNASQMGASLGPDHKTVLAHCDRLEGAFLIRRLSLEPCEGDDVLRVRVRDRRSLGLYVQSVGTPYASRARSCVTSVRPSAWACATSIRSKGSA